MAVFTEEQLTTARNLRDSGADWELVGLKMKVSGYAIRCAIDPQFKQKQLEYNTVRKKRMQEYRKNPRRSYRQLLDRHYVPKSVLVEREKRQAIYNPSIMGDPVPGYSALDKLRASKRNKEDVSANRINIL
jgi:hypothetical protein